MAKETELIKEKLDIVNFLQSYITLTPAGKNLKALCPFHQEKTPSFIVSPERRSWHCFGCGEGGDVIQFVMKYENLEFPEALRFLGEKAGVPIQTLNPAQQREFGVLYDIYEEAKNFYKNALTKNEKALSYLKDRGLLPATIEEFDLGYAPGGESLTLHLLQKKFAIDDLVRSGVSLKERTGLYRDRFQGRILFPISNHIGKVVAFTGRVFQLPPGVQEDSVPKYLNSPESAIFNKSKILFGLSKTKNDIAHARAVLIVEGQMDFLMTWQIGVKNVVAISGTGLTSQHLDRLRKLADSVILSFDNDVAGLKALERSLDLFHPFDFHVKAIALGSYKDPGEAAQKEPELIPKLVKSAPPAFHYLFEQYFLPGNEKNGIAGRKRVVKEMLSKIRKLKSAVEQDAWLKELAHHSGVSESALEEELSQIPEDKKAKNDEQSNESSHGDRTDVILKRLFLIAFSNDVYLMRLKEAQTLIPPFYRSVLENPDAAVSVALGLQSSYETTKIANEFMSLEQEFEYLLKDLKIENLKKEQVFLKQKIRSAQGKEDEEEVFKVVEQFNILSHQIDELKSSH